MSFKQVFIGLINKFGKSIIVFGKQRKGYQEDDIINMLNSHQMLDVNNNFAENILFAIENNESEKKYKNITINFNRLSYASSFICTGVFLIIINLISENSNNIIIEKVYNSTIILNSNLIDIIDKLSKALLF